jgi:glucose/arabinose dehydrogenase
VRQWSKFRSQIVAFSLLLAGSAAVAAAPAAASNDPAAGKVIFERQCLLCHTAETNDNGGAQGPSLIGVVGRRAATAKDFSYTEALRRSGLTWNPETLTRFLAAPTRLVPGTTMVTAIASERDRANVAAYLAAASEQVRNASHGAALSSALPAPPPAAASGEPDWLNDAPGRTHRIDVGSLPAPFDTPSARNFPHLVPRPSKANLALPAGFHIDEYATQLSEPRRMRLAPNGDIFVSETAAGKILVLHPAAGGAHAAGSKVYLSDLRQPFGLAFYPSAGEPRWLYVAETHRVIRYAFRTGDTRPRGEPEVVIPELPAGGGHFTRDIAFSPDGKRLFVSVGSGSNVAESMPKKSAPETATWQASHALGAAWGEETNRADVLVADVGETTHGPRAAAATLAVYASGIRNCVSLTIQPATGALWCTTNERDGLGDDLVPDYSTRVEPGHFYGWPWYYLGANEDPRLRGARPDLQHEVTIPDVLYQSHSAALNMTFYTATSGASAFPAQYVGDGFAAFHGSWNRSSRTGYKLVRVLMKNGIPTGEYQDFLTGFIVDDGAAWGRPVATLELADGSLLMSDDGANLIYRISYRR